MSMKTVRVEMGERSYDIRIGLELDFGEAVKSLAGRKALVVTDSNVEPIYGAKLYDMLASCGIAFSSIVLKAGEESKNMLNMQLIYNAALDAGLDRKCAIFALGGGVVGDIAGFAAATYMRGIAYVQVPTSLLAMVDSSVGGKTAVNLERGKNLVGSFHQPVEVDASLSALSTLPDREFSAGMAEVIKYGVIWDAEFLSSLEATVDPIMARDMEVMADVVARCCVIKSEVVAVDERESGVRGILNFGHTLGHSIEKVCGYGKYLHGEAIALGMLYALRLSVLAKSLPAEEETRIRRLVKAAGLPADFKELAELAGWKELRSAMSSDKKTESGTPRFVLAERMGGVCFGCEVSESILQGAFDVLVKESSK